MAEKKYIGKPGKQDDPCWKGYEMVGMKKKGGRKVPNCVPEATDIIAKAKAKLAEANAKYPREGFPEEGDYGYHPNPGLKPQESDKDEDMDVAYKKATAKEGMKPLNAKITEGEDMPWHEDPKNPTRKVGERKDQYGNKIKNVAKHLAKKAMKANEEVEIDEALTRVTSGNKGYGYHGNVEARDDAEKDKRYSAMHRYTKQLVAPHLQDAKKPNVMVKHFLDSAHGRHIADSPTDKNITSRFAHFKKSYNPAMHEEVEIDEGVTNPEIKKAYANLLKTPGGSAERKSAIRRYKSLRQNAVKEESDLTEATHSTYNDDRARGTGYVYRVSHDGKITGSGNYRHDKKFKTPELAGAYLEKQGFTKVVKEEVNIDKYADMLIKRDKQNLSKSHVVHAARVAGVDHKKLMSAINQKVGRIKEESEIEEAYGMWKVDFPKQHAGKAVSAGSVHVKAQNTAHAHKVAAKRVGVDHKVFKSKVTKSSILPEGVQLDEVLGKDNEWGRPELRKKFAAMTPGQEGMTADKIPTFDPRYDDVTTQYCGGIREGYLAEISAKGAEARAKFQAKVRQTLADPKNIARAKKTLAKKKEAEKAKEAPHLVMQLRKAVSIGSKVHFQDGQHHTIAPNHADIFMNKYNSAKSSIEKEALQKRAHKSHAEFMKTIAESVHENCGTPDCCQMCDTAEMGTHHVDSYEAHKGSGDQISPVISHDDEDIRFQDFDEEAFEKELEADVLALSWDDLVDLYDEDEIEYDDSPEHEEGEELEEGITPAGRLKKKFNAMRTKSRRMMARNIAIKRVSSPEKLKSRSVRAARRMVYKRLLRNRDISSVSAAEKTRLEGQIKRMAPMVARLSVRVMPAVRKLEQSRIKNSRTRKKK